MPGFKRELKPNFLDKRSTTDSLSLHFISALDRFCTAALYKFCMYSAFCDIVCPRPLLTQCLCVLSVRCQKTISMIDALSIIFTNSTYGRGTAGRFVTRVICATTRQYRTVCLYHFIVYRVPLRQLSLFLWCPLLSLNLDLDLGLPVPTGTLGSHFTPLWPRTPRFWHVRFDFWVRPTWAEVVFFEHDHCHAPGFMTVSVPLTSISCKSSLHVSCHVRFGLPPFNAIKM